MACKRMQIFMSGVLLTLVLMKPNMPVIAGAALVALVLAGARYDLSAPSRQKRMAAFKRLVKTSAVGIGLITAGLAINSGLPANIVTPADARHATFILAAYSFAVLAAPMMAWQLISLREPRQTRPAARVKAAPCTLRKIARVETARRARVAV